MNKLILFTFLLLASISFSQDYKAKILELNQQMETAISDENFEKASLIKKERELYSGLSDAIESEDFEKAAKLKSKLENLTQPPVSNDCIVYFYAGEYTGPIGGYIMTTDYPNIEMKSGKIEKRTFKPGIVTFTTNRHEKQYTISRTLEAGKIYFLEFNSKIAGGVGFDPCLKFVLFETFQQTANFQEEIEDNYQKADHSVLSNDVKLFFYLDEKMSPNTCLELNGVKVVKEFEFKASKLKYSIPIPTGENIITLVYNTTKPRGIQRQGHIRINVNAPIYLKAEYKGLKVIFTEISEEEFGKLKAKLTS